MTSTALSAVRWNYPTEVWFGPGRIQTLAALAESKEIRRPLVVTDRSLAQLPVFPSILAPLEAAAVPYAVFSEVDANPVGTNVEAGVQMFRDGGHDGVIAVGGGSPLDVGKAIALMAGQTLPLWDFEDVGDNYLRVDPAGVRPVIAVPTTAGTGSEVGRSSVITHADEGRKVIIFHPKMVPVAALLDAELTVGLPPRLTAATGIDAASHCLEAYCAPGFHPMADGIAVEGLRLVHRSLRPAYRDGADLAARGEMLVASLMGATAFQKGLGAMHAMSHPLGARLGTQHGETNAVVMPYVLASNRPVIEDRIADLARALGMKPSFDAFLEWVLELRAEFGIPHTLAGLGMTEAHIPTLAPMAAVDPAGGGNPAPLDEAGYAQLFAEALEGKLAGA